MITTINDTRSKLNLQSEQVAIPLNLLRNVLGLDGDVDEAWYDDRSNSIVLHRYSRTGS